MRICRILLYTAFGTLLLALQLSAQITTGTLWGYAYDPSGQPVSGVEVRISDAVHGVARKTWTDGAGLYRVVSLPPAQYSAIAATERFEKVEFPEVAIPVSGWIQLDFHLPLAGHREAIQVTAQVQPVSAESSELGLVLDRKRIESLPLNRRDFLQLALLTPGVSPPVENSTLSSRGAFAMHADGAREEFNNYLLDGADNNDPYVNRFVVQPSVDAVQEFRILTNNYSAEYGRNAGGQVNVITRRGENLFHGFLDEYLRNRLLDARNFFDGSQRPEYIRNQFGLGLGGPIVHDRTFVFATGDFLRERQGLSRLATVPGQAERTGDLSGLGVQIFDPFTQQPFPGNIIPQSRISPIARQVLSLYPQANLPGRGGNYLPHSVERDDETQSTVRVDHRLGPKDELTFRYSWGLADLFEPYSENTASVPGFGDFVTDRAHQALIHYERIISPNAINSVRLSFGRLARVIVPENHNRDVAGLLGVNWLQSGALDSGFPSFNVAGYSKVGDTTVLPIYRATNSYQLSEGLSIIRGKHLIKLGGEVRYMQLNSTLDLLTRGSISLSGALSGSGISDLLLGYPSFTLRSVSNNPQTLRSTAYNGYIQEDWKLSPTLTVNVGLRYEYNTPATDPTNRMSTLDPSTGMVVPVGSGGVSRSGIRPDTTNFAPRLGLAWSPGHDFVLRGGYGLYYDSGMLEINSAQYFNPPEFNLRVYFPTATSLLTLADPFPARGGFTPPPSLTVLSPDMVTAYLQHWNGSVQRTIGHLGVLSLAYAGSKGTHLVRSLDMNQPPPAPGDVQSRRPNPAYGSIVSVESGANSNYHSFQASFNRSLTRDLSLWSVYTFGKSIDDTSAFLPTKADTNFPQNSQNYRAERALSSFDVAHRLSLASIYALPHRSAWTRNTEFRSIVTLQSGQPFTPILQFDNSNTGNTGGNFGSDRPNLLRDPRLDNPGPNHWFDTAAFQLPAPFTFGNAGRNIVRGPGVVQVDVSLARTIAVGERAKFSLEVQGFNVINRTNFNLPELYADNPATFGKIFAAKPSRQIQFAGRFTF